MPLVLPCINRVLMVPRPPPVVRTVLEADPTTALQVMTSSTPNSLRPNKSPLRASLSLSLPEGGLFHGWRYLS